MAKWADYVISQANHSSNNRIGDLKQHVDNGKNLGLARWTGSFRFALKDTQTLIANKGHVDHFSRFKTARSKVHLIQNG